MLNLFVWLAATTPAASPAPINIATAAHNLEVVAGQVIAAVFAVILGLIGLHHLAKGHVIGLVGSLALAALCGIFVFAPDAVIGVVLALVATARGQ